MEPKIWGPVLWKYLHLLSINYPDYPDKKTINNHYQLLILIGKTLPCSKCANHYQYYMKPVKIKKGLKNKKNFIELILDLHNNVNEKLNKNKVSYNELLRNYQKIINSKNTEHNNNVSLILFIFILILLIIIFIIFFKYYKY